MTAKDYLEAADGSKPAVAATDVMDRLAERLNAVGSTSDQYKEMESAGQAVAELADRAEEPLAVIENAENTLGTVAQKARIGKDAIADKIKSETKEARQEAAENGLSLDHGYALDRYLEKKLEVVRRRETTDHHSDPVLSWQFTDGTVLELHESTHIDKWNFYKKLIHSSNETTLQPDLVSEEIGDPDDDGYESLSLGPTSRPWADENWIQCVTDLLAERQTTVVDTGSRTQAWEKLSNEIALSRAVSRLPVAVDQRMIHAKAAEGGGLDEIWVPSQKVVKICEEDFGIKPNALQEELTARGIDSDGLGGKCISERVKIDDSVVRFWRLDANHEDVPEPDAVIAEIETGGDRLDSLEWGGLDG